jgi:hypothetical protein
MLHAGDVIIGCCVCAVQAGNAGKSGGFVVAVLAVVFPVADQLVADTRALQVA